MITPYEEEGDRFMWPENARQLRDWTAILGAAGFHFQVDVDDEGDWVIELPSAERARAAKREIETVNRINFGWPPRLRPLISLKDRPVGSIVIVFILAGFYIWLGPATGTNPNPAHEAAHSNAIRFQNGEWWRVVTALGQHADIGHLLGNMLFILLLGWLVCRKFGDGLGSLLILLSGIAGNMIVASLPSHHRSVGASTSSFGALGIICIAMSLEYGRQFGWKSVWSQAWVPIGAGLAMLGFLGAGEGSDLGAHLFGLLAGVCLALPFSIPAKLTIPGFVQKVCAGFAFFLFFLAWRAALMHVGRP